LPRSMWSRTNSRVWPGALHQWRRLAALLHAGGGGGRRTPPARVRSGGGRTPSTPPDCRGRSTDRRTARPTWSPGPRRWRRRGPLPSAAVGSGCRRRSGAILRAPGSPAAPCSRPRAAAGPPTGAAIGGQSRCSSRRPCRKGTLPLLELEDVSGQGGLVDWGRWLLANVAG
jgi:hypothetical protein